MCVRITRYVYSKPPSENAPDGMPPVRPVVGQNAQIVMITFTWSLLMKVRLTPIKKLRRCSYYNTQKMNGCICFHSY